MKGLILPKSGFVPRTDQAVIICLDGIGMDTEFSENYDLFELQFKLSDVLEGKNIGEVDGNEIRDTESLIFIYGSDAELIFAEILPVLKTYPLSRHARVVKSYGPSLDQVEIIVL